MPRVRRSATGNSGRPARFSGTRNATSLLAAALVLAGAGCDHHSPRRAAGDDTAAIHIEASTLTVEHGTVDVGKWKRKAAYALVDARNSSARDLAVTLSGALVDAGGHQVGALRHESLRIPAGGVRTFALVDKRAEDRPGATSARVRVIGAMPLHYQAPVQVTDGHVYRDGDRVVVAAKVVDTADRRVRVIVIAGFYDARGVPMKRPFTELVIDGHASYPVRFVGPHGSAKGYVFVGQTAF